MNNNRYELSLYSLADVDGLLTLDTVHVPKFFNSAIFFCTPLTSRKNTLRALAISPSMLELWPWDDPCCGGAPTLPLATGAFCVGELPVVAAGFAIETRRDWDFEGRLGVGVWRGDFCRLLGDLHGELIGERGGSLVICGPAPGGSGVGRCGCATCGGGG